MGGSVPENDVVTKESVGGEANNSTPKQPPANVDKKKKQGRALHLFIAALSALRRQRSKEREAKKALAKQKSNKWKKIVGSLRPLCVQQSARIDEKTSRNKRGSSGEKSTLAEMIQLPSPSASSPCSTMSSHPSFRSTMSSYPSFSGSMCSYASAMSLYDLDYSSSDEEEDPDEMFDALAGDVLIDDKAEEFIEQFYREIHMRNACAAAAAARCRFGMGI